MKAFHVSLAVVCSLIVIAGAFSSSLGTSESNNSVIPNTLIWKQTLPKYVVTQNDFHNNYWSYNVTQAFGAPTIVNGVLYIGCSGVEKGGHNEGVHAYNAYSGQELWNYSVTYDPYSTLTLADGVVYVGSNSGLLALRASDGSKLWNVSESTEYVKTSHGTYSPLYNAMFFASPAVADGVVYDVSRNANLIAFGSANGEILWNYTIQTGPYFPFYGSFTSPVVYNGMLYVGCQDYNVYALNSSTDIESGLYVKALKAWESVH